MGILDSTGRSLPRLSNSKFDLSMPALVIEMARQGGSKTAMALACGVSMSTFRKWTDIDSPQRIPELAEALELGMMLSQVTFEEIGRRAAEGKLKNHASGTYTFLMKNMFKEAYSDTQVTKHEGSVTISVSPTMTAIDAAQKYKEFLANSSTTLLLPEVIDVDPDDFERFLEDS